MFPGPLKNKRLRNFLHETTIHGLRLILYYTPFKYARLIWSLLIFVLIVWTHLIIARLTTAYMKQPTEVHISTNLKHISDVKFPSVAACSANKFSRTKVLQFAEKLFESQQLYKPYLVAHTVEEMAQHLLLLKKFYVFAYDNEPLNKTLLDGLDELFTDMFKSANYPIRNLLSELAPDCKDLVVAGMIYGSPINISEYINKRLTSSSACCLFNYNRKSYLIGVDRRYQENKLVNRAQQIKFESSSALNSVQFALQSNPEDFTVTEFQTTAFQLFIFPPNDYATIQSNRIGEILVDYNTVVEVPIEPEYVISSYRIRQFSSKLRDCYFRDEGQKFLNQSFYSLNECLLLCRMDSMLKHCGCVAPPMAATNKNISQCNFPDLPCLMKWKGIWYGWRDYQYEQDGREIKYKFANDHRCPECLPTCNSIEYFLNINIKPLHRSDLPFKYDVLKALNITKKISIVSLFFKYHYILTTEMDIVSDWVVLLNRFGGIMSLMYGFSIVSYIEILYFASGKFFYLHFENWKSKVERNLKILQKPQERKKNNAKEKHAPPPCILYWNELQPQRVISMEVYKQNLITHLYKKPKI